MNVVRKILLTPIVFAVSLVLGLAVGLLDAVKLPVDMTIDLWEKNSYGNNQ